jgi:hypothetical protein
VQRIAELRMSDIASWGAVKRQREQEVEDAWKRRRRSQKEGKKEEDWRRRRRPSIASWTSSLRRRSPRMRLHRCR